MFDFRNDDPNYTLSIKQTLTIKPKDYYIHVFLRKGINPLHLEKLISGSGSEGSQGQETPVAAAARALVKPLAIYLGGNMGTCEGTFSA